ncbi:MAG: biotin/lipoyl-containing protein [Streptococcus salivarius]
MPKLGLTMTEGLIQKWLVQVGDTVTSGQPLLEISSEKLTSEVEFPSGVTVHGEGVTVKCKEVVGWVGQEGEDVWNPRGSAQEEVQLSR